MWFIWNTTLWQKEPFDVIWLGRCVLTGDLTRVRTILVFPFDVGGFLWVIHLYGETGAACLYRAFFHHYRASLCVDCVQRLIVMCCIIGSDPCCSAGLGSHSPTGRRSAIRQLYPSAALCRWYLRAAMLCVSHRPQLLISRLIRKV